MFRNPEPSLRGGHPARGIRSVLTAASLVAACATCDASSALAPAAMRVISMAWDGDTILVAGSSQPAAVVVTVDGVTHPIARLRLASSDAGIVSVGADGVTLTAHRLGVATLTATLLDAALPTPAPSLATTLVVSPGTLRLAAVPDTLRSLGDTVRLVVRALDAAGSEIAGVLTHWTSSDSLVATVSTDGLVTAHGNGSAEIRGRVGASTVSAPVVTRQRAAAVRFTPASLLLDALGADTACSATVLDARGSPLGALTPAMTWSSGNPAVASIAGERVTANANGTAWMHVVAGPARDSLAVEVRQRATRVVVETPSPVALHSIGQTVAMRARAYDRRANEVQRAAPTWRSLNPLVVHVDALTGVATGLSAGSATLSAELDGASAPAAIDVSDEVASIDITPASASLTSLGDVLYPTVAARNGLGTVVATPELTWTIHDTTVARLLPDGAVLAVAIGITRVVVSAGSIADTMVVSVSNLPALIDIAPAADTIPAVGDSVALRVAVSNARGDSLPATTLTWAVDDPVVARVSSSGTVTARATGSTWVRVSGGTARDSIWILVTNEPAAVTMTLSSTGAHATIDTMTAAGQALDYDAVATNLVGLLIADATIAWRSTDPAVAAVSPAGVATAMGFGTAWVIAQAGTRSDSVRLVVADPRRVYVDNAVVTAPRFGTLARPFATIQGAVNAAGVDDTVIVFRGNSYSESVTLGRRVTLLGDSAAFAAGGRDPLLLPLLRHDLGTAGISTGTPGASYSIRYLGIQHSVDGEAITIRDADNVVMSDVYVNPIPGFRTGRGILVDGATGTVSIARSRVDSVYGFGIRIRNAATAQLQGVTVRGVAARSGFAGTGIEVIGGTAAVSGAVVRRTTGPQVHFAGTTGASLLASTLTGEQQLVRLDSVRGTTTVGGNTFDMRLQGGETGPTRGSVFPDPSGLEINGSAGVLVDANVFIDIGGQASLMDGVRLAGVRVGASGAAHGALLTANQFRGGRSAVRSARSTWTMQGSRIDSASVGVLLTEADTVTLSRDTIALSRVAGVQSTGAGTRLVMTMNAISGAQRAIVASSAAEVQLRNNVITGTAFTGFAQPTLGAVDIGATAAEVVGNSIISVRGWTALVLRQGTVRADSNFVSRNIAGVRLGTASLPTLVRNAIFDNDTLPNGSRRAAVGAVNTGALRTIGKNWWGAPEGPQSDAPLAPTARGDSVVGGLTTDTLMAPIADHRGAGNPAALRKIAGDGQSGTINTKLSALLTGRAVDAAGRPLAGASVTFRVDRTLGNFTGGSRSGNEHVVTLTSDASGLAGAEYIPLSGGTSVVTVSTSNGSSITFTVTVP